MSKQLCPICGWGTQIKQPCQTVMEAVLCDLIKENWRKYTLRYQGEISREELQVPVLVRSVRGFDPTDKDGPGKGNSKEELVPVSIEVARTLLDGEVMVAAP